jgi:hypothetical protein
MQLCFVSVHGPRETYFVDEPRTSRKVAGWITDDAIECFRLS